MQQDIMEQFLDFVRGRYFGKYRGTVVNNKDKTGRGRIQVHVPAVLGDLHVWAMPCVPYAGDQVGWLCLPEPGTGVWVEFEGGDPSFPIWVGCFWADKQLPKDSQPDVKLWKTKTIAMLLNDEKEALVASSKSGARLTLVDEVKTESGNSIHKVSRQGIQSQSGQGGKLDISGAVVKINDGALEVS